MNPVLLLAGGGDRLPLPGKGSFDLAYLTEVDPLWNDDELTLILNPDAVLFANPVAIAACAADCVAARGLRDPGDVLVRRLPGRPLSHERPCSVPHGRRAHRRADGPAADRQDAPRADRLGLARHTRPVRTVLPARHGQDRLQDPAHPPNPGHRRKPASAASPSAARPSPGAPARSTRYAARTSAFMLFRKRNCCVGY